ncbi:unnamed protein product [Fraxinus pennsylvanica]|uniref:HTH myb-type domain-containing protein n=1 Tax=Fraxinus pennsylvanica TaxID=56036 RepID=A0AAD1ZMG3_9LAMI|nr:unnamed protein product [Fraxinus pennsylvanica]
MLLAGVLKLAGMRRCGKSCRLRWTNYLCPDLKRGLLTEAEEQLVIDLHASIGNRYIYCTEAEEQLVIDLHASIGNRSEVVGFSYPCEAKFIFLQNLYELKINPVQSSIFTES